MTEEKIQSFKDLRIWQKGMEIVIDVYKLTEKFPEKEQYSLTNQMRKAAVSLPSNIAEGFRRFHNKEYLQFLHITLGSAAELETQLIIAKELGYINEAQMQPVCEKIDSLSRMITVLRKKLVR